MSYWLHRVEKHCNGINILFGENRLIIGFSACANNEDFFLSFTKSQNEESYRNGAYGNDFDALYWKVYNDIWRQRWSLWYFIHDMTDGDLVVVPYSGGFCICRLKGRAQRSDRRLMADIGWEWDVDILAKGCVPRECYATTRLLSRMKCRQTTLCLDELSTDVDLALSKFVRNKPFDFQSELAQKCHDLLDTFGTPDQFEQIVRNYFIRQGGQAEILSKNYAGKEGDCDVVAIFPALRLNIQVQCKKHWGETNEWAVRQISEYAEAETESEGWSYEQWVISFADEFSEQARLLAKQKNVILISGREFCKMIVESGISGL